ncbi:MAG: hypothetical protein IJK44_02000 [Bacteroidales bacterium]|nr:hypothetical protein [Bacteroidales bacterium]
MSHFNTPSSGIKFKSPFGINAHIRRDEGVPGAVALLVKEDLSIHAGILGLAGVIMSEKVFEFRDYLSIFVHG